MLSIILWDFVRKLLIIMERCKGSVELLNSRARRVNKTEDLFLCDGYCKLYPKGLPLSMPPPVLVLGRAALAYN